MNFKIISQVELRNLKTPLFLLGSPFQKRVWEELQKIPRVKTRSYAEIAKAIGKPTAFRAVALANGANQLAIVILPPVCSIAMESGRIWRRCQRKEWLLIT